MLCEYGCGQEAKHQFKNGKWCCSNNITKCPINKERFKKNNPMLYKEYRKKVSLGLTGKPSKLKGRTYEEIHGVEKSIQLKQQKSKYGKERYNTIEKRNEVGQKISLAYKQNIELRKRKMLTEKIIKERYPFFYQIEEIKDDEINGGVLVHCKNHTCPNSKEKGGWFKPTTTQLYCRIISLENEDGNDGSYLYCSDECKHSCPLYFMRASTKIDKIEEENTTELYIFKQEVLKRQEKEIGYNECELCGSKENLHVHHEKPQKTHPHMSLDPDNGIIVCKICHYEKLHKGKCSTINLAHLNCKKRILND